MCVHTFAYISTQIDHSNPPGNPRATPSAVASLELDPPLAKSSSADQVSSAVPELVLEDGGDIGFWMFDWCLRSVDDWFLDGGFLFSVDIGFWRLFLDGLILKGCNIMM